MPATPTEMLTGYVRAFETSSAEAVVPYYELPCTFVRPDGVWVVHDEAAAVVLVNHLIEHARSQGYHRTDISRRSKACSCATMPRRRRSPASASPTSSAGAKADGALRWP